MASLKFDWANCSLAFLVVFLVDDTASVPNHLQPYILESYTHLSFFCHFPLFLFHGFIYFFIMSFIFMLVLTQEGHEANAWPQSFTMDQMMHESLSLPFLYQWLSSTQCVSLKCRKGWEVIQWEVPLFIQQILNILQNLVKRQRHGRMRTRRKPWQTCQSKG